MLAIFLCCICVVLLFNYSETPRTGNQLFKDAILNPIPKSVVVLDSFDPSPDFQPDLCLHFKISPSDFKLILASRKWKVVSENPIGAECEPWLSMPPSLGSNVIIYSFVPEKNDVEVMFTNTQMDEVYYYYHDGNSP